jgi:hypothetical protein
MNFTRPKSVSGHNSRITYHCDSGFSFQSGARNDGDVKHRDFGAKDVQTAILSVPPGFASPAHQPPQSERPGRSTNV